MQAIALDLTTFLGGGQVNVQEVGDALARFHTAGKPIYAFGVAYTDDAMTLAAHADEIWIDPMGGVLIQGPGGTNLYYGAALERFNIKAHVYKVGTYKSAVEPFTGTGMSDPARENAQGFVNELWDEWRAHVKQARAKADIEAATTGLIDLVAANEGDFAKAALAAGMADRIGTHDEWGARIARVVGADSWEDRPGSFVASELDAYLAEIAPDTAGVRTFGGGGQTVGVITIAGEITDGEAGPGSAGAARIERLLDNALDNDLAALVIRVDSPGGSVSGSEVIRRAIMRHKANGIPIAVSMGNYAASGGYWISTPGDRIFAEPETLTGSIGVFLVIPTFEDLLADFGVTTDGVQTTALSGQPDLFAGFTPETEALLQSETEAIYARFLGLVGQSRNMAPARVDALAQGRVWTGGAARQLGLVDQFGDLDAALAWAAKQAEIGDDYRVEYLQTPPDPYVAFVEGMMGDETSAGARLTSISALFAQRERDLTARIAGDFDRLMTVRGVQARCLDCLPYERSNTLAKAAVPTWISALARRILAH